MEEDKKQDGVILEIDYNFYEANAIVYIVVGVMLYTLTLIFDRSIEAIARSVAIGGVVFGIFRLIRYRQNTPLTIKFTTEKVLIQSENINMNHSDIQEIYRVSVVYFEALRKIRIGNIGKFVFAILFPIIFLISFIVQLVKSMYYRRNFLFYEILIMIGKNDKEFIAIQLPLKNTEEQNNLEDYCKKYLNTDITKLPRLWFIPEKKI